MKLTNKFNETTGHKGIAAKYFVGAFVLWWLYFSGAIGWGQTLETDILNTNGIVLVYNGGPIFLPQGVSHYHVTSGLISQFGYTPLQYMDTNHDWTFSDSYGYGILTSYPIGTIDANNAYSISNAIAGVLNNANIINNSLGLAVSQGDQLAASQYPWEAYVQTAVQGGVSAVVGSSAVQNALNGGLYLGATVVAALLGFSFIRSIPGGGREDM